MSEVSPCLTTKVCLTHHVFLLPPIATAASQLTAPDEMRRGVANDTRATLATAPALAPATATARGAQQSSRGGDDVRVDEVLADVGGRAGGDPALGPNAGGADADSDPDPARASATESTAAATAPAPLTSRAPLGELSRNASSDARPPSDGASRSSHVTSCPAASASSRAATDNDLARAPPTPSPADPSSPRVASAVGGEPLDDDERVAPGDCCDDDDGCVEAVMEAPPPAAAVVLPADPPPSAAAVSMFATNLPPRATAADPTRSPFGCKVAPVRTGCAGASALFAADAKLWEPDSNDIASHVAFLHDGSPDEREHALWSVHELVQDEGHLLAVVDAGAILPLVALLHDDDPTSQAKAAFALACIASPYKQDIPSPCGTRQGDASSERGSESRKAIISAGGVPPLVSLVRVGASLLKSGDRCANCTALLHAANMGERALCMLMSTCTTADDAAAVAAIGNAGLIPPLVSLLESQLDRGISDREQLAARRPIVRFVRLLHKLTIRNGEFSAEVVATGAIPLLVGIVRDPQWCRPTEAKTHAASILAGLAASSPEFLLAVVGAGAIRPLCRIVGRSCDVSSARDVRCMVTADAQEAATEALVCIGGHVLVYGAPVVCDGCFGDLPADETAAMAFRMLTVRNRPRYRILREGPPVTHGSCFGNLSSYGADLRLAIPSLVKLVQRGTPYSQRQAACSLANIAIHCAENGVLIARNGGIPALISLVEGWEDCDWDLARRRKKTRVCEQDPFGYAAVALGRLCIQNAENQVAIVRAGGVVPLVTLAREGAPDAQESAAYALRNLAHGNAVNRGVIAAAGYTEPCAVGSGVIARFAGPEREAEPEARAVAEGPKVSSDEDEDGDARMAEDEAGGLGGGGATPAATADCVAAFSEDFGSAPVK